MSWVFEHSRSKKNARLVLLAIADCANDEGRQAYPSMRKLQQKTGLGERAVTGLVGELEKLGELEVKRNAGPSGCNLYRVVMTPAKNAPPQNLHPAKTAGAKKKQVKAVDPASSAPPAENAPPQKTTDTPAESAPGTIQEPSDKTSSTKKSSRAPEGRRLPDDFPVTDAMRSWAAANAPLCGRADHDAFCDYWRDQPGAKGRKVNWVGTWKNWMRREQERRTPNGRASPSRQLVEHNGLMLKPETVAQLELGKRFEAMDRQNAIEGPR